MSSSSPPRNPTPTSSGSAPPDFELTQTNPDDDQEEVSSQLDPNNASIPQPIASYDPNNPYFPDPIASYDPNFVFSPQPISSYDPNQPHFFSQPIPPFIPNLAHMSNAYSGYDPGTLQDIKSRGVDMNDIMMRMGHQAFGSYNLPESVNVYPEIDQEIANVMRGQGMGMSDLERQRQALDRFNQKRQSLPRDPAGISKNEALVQGKKSGMRSIKERARRGGEAQIQQGNPMESAAIQDTNVRENTEMPIHEPVEFEEPGESNVQPEEDDGGEFDDFLFDTTENIQEDDCQTLKLLVRLRKDGNISLPKHVVKARFNRKKKRLEAKYDDFVTEHGKKLFSRNAFSSKSGYQMYRMSRFLWGPWGEHIIQSGGSGFSTGVARSFDLDDYRNWFDPNAPFYHPDMQCYPYDQDKPNDQNDDPGVVVDPNGPSVPNGSNVSVVDVDPNGSYLDPNEELEPDDPYFDDGDDLVLERIQACFGSLDPIPAPVTRATAAGQKIIVKAPLQPQTVDVNSGRDRELEAVTTRASEITLGEVPEDTEGADIAHATGISLGKVPEDTKGERIADQIDMVPLKKRYADQLAELIDNDKSKRRKLLDSPPNALPEAWHQMQQDEENMLLLPNSDNVEDDDYETLKLLMLCPLQQTFTMQWGFLPPNFEISLTEHINWMLSSHHKITTGQCKMKVGSLFKKFFKFRELNGVEDLTETHFSVSREYEMYKMFRTLWVDGPESGGPGSAGGSELDPTPAPVTRVSAAGQKLVFKAPQAQAINAQSGREREFEDDIARAIRNSLEDGQGGGESGSSGDPESCLKQGVNASNTVQGASDGKLEDIKMNVNSDNLEEPGKNMDAGNAAEPGAGADQVNVPNMVVDGGQENVDKMKDLEVDGSSDK